jgi:hypothetical protein
VVHQHIIIILEFLFFICLVINQIWLNPLLGSPSLLEQREKIEKKTLLTSVWVFF